MTRLYYKVALTCMLMKGIVNKMNEQDIEKSSGTSFQGYIYARYDQLCLAFGEPCIPNSLDKKTDAEWIINTPHGVATIYNYKNGKRYMGKSGLDISIICEWHVGAKNIEAFEWIKSELYNSIGSTHSSEESSS